MSIPNWDSLTTDEVRQLVARDPVIILPVGSIEQHGPHLPLSTDLDIALGLIDRTAQLLPVDFPAAVLPAQSVGASQEHDQFDGTLSLESHELSDIVVSLGASLARSGIRRLALFNSHGGNLGSLAAAALRLRKQCRQLVVKLNYFLIDPPSDLDLPAAEWQHGLHGGAVETAIMLHCRPHVVRTDKIRTTRSLGEDLDVVMRRLGPETPGTSFAWLAGDLTQTGVTGDATLATASLGERLVDHYGQALADALRDTKDFPLDRLVP